MTRARAVRAGPLAGMARGGAWRGERPRGFTLVELLVVVAIVALLMAVLMPQLQKAMETSRRSVCAANLNGIGKALTQYGTQQKTYPYIPLKGGGWGVEIGTSRDTNPYVGAAATDRSPSACLYLLVRKKFCQRAMFICPSTEERETKESGSFWDFADGVKISYAFLNPYGPERYFDSSLDGDVPIMADSSPFFDPATGLRNAEAVVDLTDEEDEEVFQKGNSPNHKKDGQNVAVINGSTTWNERANVGSDMDNIYTRAAAGDTDQKGDLPAAGADASADDQGPASANDSYLVQ